jgi:hypothetical protein
MNSHFLQFILLSYNISMRIMIFPILILSLQFLSVSGAFGWPQGKPVTPYGDSCPQCGKYGTCNTTMTDYDAEKALKDYYNKKGLTVEIEKKKGRFIRAKIYNKTGIADIIIFDRQTGRIRSIY